MTTPNPETEIASLIWRQSKSTQHYRRISRFNGPNEGVGGRGLTQLCRSAGFFLARRLAPVLTIVLTISAIIYFTRIITSHPTLEVSNSFAKTLGYFRYSTRTEQNDDD